MKQIRANRWVERNFTGWSVFIIICDHKQIHTYTHTPIRIREQACFVRSINRFKYLFLMSFISFVMFSGYFFSWFCLYLLLFSVIFRREFLFFILKFLTSIFFYFLFFFECFFSLLLFSFQRILNTRRKLPAQHYGLKTVCFA